MTPQDMDYVRREIESAHALNWTPADVMFDQRRQIIELETELDLAKWQLREEHRLRKRLSVITWIAVHAAFLSGVLWFSN